MLSISVLPVQNGRATNTFRRFNVPFTNSQANSLLREFIYNELLKVRLGEAFGITTVTSLTEGQLAELYAVIPTVAGNVVLAYPLLANLRRLLRHAVQAQQQDDTPLMPGYERWDLHMRFVGMAEIVFAELLPIRL